MRHSCIAHRLLVALILTPMSVSAGMPSLVFTDVARMRLDAISFFLLAYLILGRVVQGLWNSLACAFPKLPALTFRQGLALMLLSGLLLYVVLTMIAGARELMTPGAWRKEGLTYRLTNDFDSNVVRRQSMVRLKETLWQYASAHDGAFPDSVFEKGLPPMIWETPSAEGWYCYLGGGKVGEGRKLIAYEPHSVGKVRWVMLADGSVESWEDSVIEELLRRKTIDP